MQSSQSIVPPPVDPTEKTPVSTELSDQQDTHHYPDPNTFCGLDAIDLLAQDENAYLHPWHKSFVYKCIGRKTENDGDYPKFEQDENVAFPIGSLNWNKKRLNLSLLGRIDGHIQLGKGVRKHGFANPFRTFIWRNYTIIKDGVLNVTVLPVSCSEATFDKLQQEGLITESMEWAEDRIFEVNLSAIPVMSQGMVDSVSAFNMAQLAGEELKYSADAKVAKALLNILQPEEKKISDVFTPEQDEFLKTHGITSNGFNPPRKQAEAVDYYMARTFEIKARGFSSLPKLESVLERHKSGATQTKAGAMMLQSFENIEEVSKDLDEKDKIKALTRYIEDTQHNLNVVRSEMARVKFAVILGKKWFPEFDTRDNPQITYNGITFTFALGEQKVEI